MGLGFVRFEEQGGSKLLQFSARGVGVKWLLSGARVGSPEAKWDSVLRLEGQGGSKLLQNLSAAVCEA